MDIDELVKKAMELRNKGLRSGEIADELNVSSETATWLLTRPTKEAPKDIFGKYHKPDPNTNQKSQSTKEKRLFPNRYYMMEYEIPTRLTSPLYIIYIIIVILVF